MASVGGTTPQRCAADMGTVSAGNVCVTRAGGILTTCIMGSTASVTTSIVTSTRACSVEVRAD